MRIRWLRTASRNLDAAMEYSAREDPDAAQRIYAHIRKSVVELAKHPERGRSGRIFGTRELVIEKYPYLVPYRIQDNEVQALRVFHTSQRPRMSGRPKTKPTLHGPTSRHGVLP